MCVFILKALYEYITKYSDQLQVAEFGTDTILQPYETNSNVLIFDF
jgi:hypothetical protein